MAASLRLGLKAAALYVKVRQHQNPIGEEIPFLRQIVEPVDEEDVFLIDQCFFCMILSVHANKMADAKKVMWMKIFHFKCSGFSLATSTNPFKR